MSTPKLFDVHTHLQFHAFKDDADLVIQRALAAGIWMVNVGTQVDTSQAAINIAEKFKEGVYAAVGLHPIHTQKSFYDKQELGGAAEFTSRGENFDPVSYKKLAQHPKVVAIGECGLDYYRLEPDTKEKQKKAFLQQIELAQEVSQPLMVHCRQAFGDLISVLTVNRLALNDPPGIIHFFSGTKDDAKQLLDLGFSFSFGGVITFTRDYDEVLNYIPLNRLLLETDAPYVAPVPYRGRRNEPVYVVEVAKKLAEIKKTSMERVAETTFANANKIFHINKPSSRTAW